MLLHGVRPGTYDPEAIKGRHTQRTREVTIAAATSAGRYQARPRRRVIVRHSPSAPFGMAHHLWGPFQPPPSIFSTNGQIRLNRASRMIFSKPSVCTPSGCSSRASIFLMAT